MTTEKEKADAALAHLTAARDLLTEIRAVKTLARVRLAISSAKGAARHAAHAPYRAERGTLHRNS
jgi:hypothetical protein